MTWKTRQLRDIVIRLQNGGTPSTKTPELWNGNIPWISGADFGIQRVARVRRYITAQAVRMSSTNVVPKGDLLLVTRTGVGKMAIAPFNVAISQDITGIEFVSEISPKFMLFKLHHEIGYFLALIQGTSINGITRNDLLEFETELPASRTEQERIAEILSTVDAAIDQTQALIDKYNRIKGGLIQELLTRGIDENGKIRSKVTHKFSVKNGIEVPDEWDVVPLGQLSEPITSGSRGWASHYTVEGDKFIRIGNLSREHIDFRLDNIVFVDPPDGAERVRTELIEGDILVSITADLGMVGVIPKDFGAAYNNQHIARIRVTDRDTDPRWIGYFLLCEIGQSQFQMLNESGAKAGLNLPTVASLLIAVPQGSEQRRIVVMLDSTLGVIECHRRTLVKLNATKKGLMQDLLSGSKRVKVDA